MREIQDTLHGARQRLHAPRPGAPNEGRGMTGAGSSPAVGGAFRFPADWAAPGNPGGAPAPPTAAAHPAGKAMPSTGSPLGLLVLLGAGVTGGGALKRRAAGSRG